MTRHSLRATIRGTAWWHRHVIDRSRGKKTKLSSPPTPPHPPPPNTHPASPLVINSVRPLPLPGSPLDGNSPSPRARFERSRLLPVRRKRQSRAKAEGDNSIRFGDRFELPRRPRCRFRLTLRPKEEQPPAASPTANAFDPPRADLARPRGDMRIIGRAPHAYDDDARAIRKVLGKRPPRRVPGSGIDPNTAHSRLLLSLWSSPR